MVDAALVTATFLREPLNVLPFLRKIPVVNLPPILYLVFPLMWVGVLLLFSVYDGRRNLRVMDEVSSLAFGSLLAVVSLAGVLYLSYRDVSRFLFLMTAGLAFLCMLAWRAIARLAFKRHGLHSRPRRVLILGAGTIGRIVASQIVQQRQAGLALVGFLDDDAEKQATRVDVLGSLDGVRRVVIEQGIDDVVFALPVEAHERLTAVACMLHDLPLHVWVIPDYFSLVLHRAKPDEFSGIPMLDLRAPALNEYQRLIKRVFDLFLTLLLMPFALPVVGIVALIVRLDSPGPIFYRTRRAGENGRVFQMYKFRTMVVGADKMLRQALEPDQNGVVNHKKSSDPRITRAGRILRRTSLDELPQLFNVFKGDMSLVGPRPELPELVERYSLWQRERFAVPQGMTGWWQVNGRSDRPLHLNTDDDLYYVRNYSLWLDVTILFRTAWVVLRGKGAF
jgi:exopolysaccharide biosynthesis polyprenyl glycosylphosphotransferase